MGRRERCVGGGGVQERGVCRRERWAGERDV